MEEIQVLGKDVEKFRILAVFFSFLASKHLSLFVRKYKKLAVTKLRSTEATNKRADAPELLRYVYICQFVSSTNRSQ